MRKKIALFSVLLIVLLIVLAAAGSASAQRYRDENGQIRVALVKMPYRGARNVPELSEVPDYLEEGGIARMLRREGYVLKPTRTVALTPEEQQDYGEWHRLGLANGHLADIVSDNESTGYLTVGLLANCSSLLGVLAGLQDSGPTRRPQRIGLVFIDAHGDFNTPETTLSGMLGGMPVAISAGMCLTNLRLKSGLDPALPTRHIVMGGVRDLDPLEHDLLDRSDVEMISVDDIRKQSEAIDRQMERLSELVDLIYIHIDMDVLDPREVAGHPLTVPNGPASQELAAALAQMFRYPKAAALGIASTPAGANDPEGLSRQAAYRLIRGALAGIKARGQ